MVGTLAACAGPLLLAAPLLAADQPGPAYRQLAPLPVRLQWNANGGYCGESALIAAGMSLGQYTSQWTARAAANGFAPDLDQTLPSSQLLIGWPADSLNWAQAARLMRLDAIAFVPEPGRPADANAFLGWIKHRFLLGDRVIIGVFDNAQVLGAPPPGDSAYDHIVSVIGIASNQPLSANDRTYRGDDRLTISDHGLFTPLAPGGVHGGAGNTADNPRGSTLYTASFAAIQKSRAEANALPPGGCDGNGCSPYLYALNNNATREGHHGIAITGVADQDRQTLPVSLIASTDGEGLHDETAMRQPPAPAPLTLTITVGTKARPLDPASTYRLYAYRSFADVPRAGFNAAAAASPGSLLRTWTITGQTMFQTQLSGLSTAGTYAFRAVPASAP